MIVRKLVDATCDRSPKVLRGSLGCGSVSSELAIAHVLHVHSVAGCDDVS